MMGSRQIMMVAVLCVGLGGGTVGTAQVINLIGDKDGFGVGCPVESGRNFLDYGMFFTDYREADDPSFTDTWLVGSQSWTHAYDLAGQTPLSATLELFVAGIENYAGGTGDIQFAGTSIGTIPGIEGAYDLTRLLTFNVPVNLLTGSDPVLIGVSNPMDGWIVDYSQLIITTQGNDGPVSVPAPGAILLGAIGVMCLKGIRKHCGLC